MDLLVIGSMSSRTIIGRTESGKKFPREPDRRILRPSCGVGVGADESDPARAAIVVYLNVGNALRSRPGLIPSPLPAAQPSTSRGSR